MDQATALKIAQNYRVPPTPGNISRIMQEAPNESALLGRSMGLQGSGGEEGYDDSLLKAQLSKLVGEDITPKGNVAAESIAPASTINPPQSGMPKRLGTAVPTSTNRSGPNAGTRGDELSTPVASAPTPVSTNRDMGYGTSPDVSNTNAPDTGGGLNWLLALLGLGATAGRGAMSPSSSPITPNPQLTGPGNQTRLGYELKLGYEPKLTDQSGPKYPSGATTIPEGPMSVAPPGTIPPRKEPVRPQFNDNEMLVDALMNFRKMFRK